MKIAHIAGIGRGSDRIYQSAERKRRLILAGGHVRNRISQSFQRTEQGQRKRRTGIDAIGRSVVVAGKRVKAGGRCRDIRGKIGQSIFERVGLPIDGERHVVAARHVRKLDASKAKGEVEVAASAKPGIERQRSAARYADVCINVDISLSIQREAMGG